jgi:hypothetical protein
VTAGCWPLLAHHQGQTLVGQSKLPSGNSVLLTLIPFDHLQ